MADMDGLDQFHLKIVMTTALCVDLQGVDPGGYGQCFSFFDERTIFSEKGSKSIVSLSSMLGGRALNSPVFYHTSVTVAIGCSCRD